MNGKHVIQILTHLFRKRGSHVEIEEAVSFLSFRCRLGRPSDIRRLLTIALENEMVNREGNSIKAGFLYEKQELPIDLVAAFGGPVRMNSEKKPMQ